MEEVAVATFPSAAEGGLWAERVRSEEAGRARELLAEWG